MNSEEWIPCLRFRFNRLSWLSHPLPFPRAPIVYQVGPKGQDSGTALPQTDGLPPYTLPNSGETPCQRFSKGRTQQSLQGPPGPRILGGIHSALVWVSLSGRRQHVPGAWIWGRNIISSRESCSWAWSHSFLDRLIEWRLFRKAKDLTNSSSQQPYLIYRYLL